MQWLTTVETWIKWFATQVPLEIFVLVGSFIEELIGPIPSTLVMATAGAFAQLEDRTLLFVVWLAILGAVGKTLGAWIYYILGDKLEDVTVRKFGSYLGVSHGDIESIGSRFGRSHWKDGSVLLALRMIPFFPSTIVSIACGAVKIHPHIYLPVTWFGSFVKDLLYAYTGYAGINFLQKLWQDAERMRWGLDALLWACLLGFVVFGYWHRERVAHFIARLVERYRTP